MTVFALAGVLALALAGCGGGDDDGGGGNADAANGGGSDSAANEFAPAGISEASLQLIEQGGPTNTWTFPAGSGTSGMANLMGVGDFPFTYSKTGATTSLLEFDVGGTDSFDMTWVSATEGTMMQSFDGTPGNMGTFILTPN
jgi:hypothetical protein